MNVIEISWATTINDIFSGNLPFFEIGWLADFADADDLCRPYMYSNGAYAYYQNYSAGNGWGTLKDQLVDTAALTPDGPARQALYDQLARIYYNDCPAFPVSNPLGRIFQWYWVKGWYCDAVYPGRRIYTTWKQDTPWYDVSGTTPGVSDGVVNMRDIAYLVLHFNANPLDSKWAGVYGANGCVDPFGDRKCDMKDIAGAIQNFNAKGPGHP